MEFHVTKHKGKMFHVFVVCPRAMWPFQDSNFVLLRNASHHPNTYQLWKRNLLHFSRTNTRLACRSKLRKVFVRIKLGIGLKVVWHLHICMAKACLFEFFAIFVSARVQCCWPFIRRSRKTYVDESLCQQNSRNNFTFLGKRMSHLTGFSHFHLGGRLSTGFDSEFRENYGSR